MKNLNKCTKFAFLVVLFYVNCWKNSVLADQRHDGIPCYDDTGKAQKCIPQFENAAFGLPAEATNTCGHDRPIQYCVLSNTQGIEQGCNWCNSSSQHSTAYMTDFSSTDTWWQSETMFEEIQAPNHVNLTLHFGKTFDITHITLTFKSPRPHSFAIYKKTTDDGPWVPYQYYSADCQGMYGLPDENYIRPGKDEKTAFCTSEFSDISPTTDGTIAFATLAGRPSAYEFRTRPELWEWVTASAIRITLNRLNTYGDEIWQSDPGLRSYFYAISDLSIGARCKCNGHAADCIKSTNSDGGVRRTCRCDHRTSGPDCNECMPFYNDLPWQRASEEEPFECRECNCNGFSNRCYFDKELYQQSGHGGHCLECSSNRDGANCERCRPNYYQPMGETACFPCNCHETGSRNLQCNSEGKCSCKDGVTGDKCDHCANNYYNFDSAGCKECGCSVAGSRQNQASCDAVTGVCQCKENVEGKQCSSCKPGFFNLDEMNEFGCSPCFCYGHSSVCHSAIGYSKVTLDSSFIRGTEKWKAESLNSRPAELSYNTQSQALEIAPWGAEDLYFVASDRYLGDQRASYNHDLTFKLRINENSPIFSINDVVLQGVGFFISQTIFGQNNSAPSTAIQQYKFRLHEHPMFGWQPRLSTRDFISLLSNVTAIKIRATYTPVGSGYLDDVSLETARRDAAGMPASWVETCSCPEGYGGQYCESCDPGFRHDPRGPFGRCVPCNCNQHAKICDADTGRCICEHNTAGENCDRCARGYFGNALKGTAFDCKTCPCPNQGACMLIGDDDQIVCLECPPGYAGPVCEMCSDGYYGDPKSVSGSTKVCQPCDCNLNIDTNAIGNCNRTTGECLKCTQNTGGFHCDQCLPGYYGDALAAGKADCKSCLCHTLGTLEFQSGELNCDQFTGQCKCKAHVTGRNCDECEVGYYDINSGEGCKSCGCNAIGSLNTTCNVHTGQCHCRPGVTGQYCDKCIPEHYGFSLEGCKACNCDNTGATSMQCDDRGQCPCLKNIEGKRCDRCRENKFDKLRGCIDCPACYNLVKNAADSHRHRLKMLSESIANISSSDSVSLDADFEETLKAVRKKVVKLDDDVKATTSQEGQLTSTKLDDFYRKLNDINNVSKDITNLTNVAKSVIRKAESNVTEAEQNIEQARRNLMSAEEYLLTDGKSALEKAVQKSAEVGEQNVQMSQMARDARAAVQKQEEEAEKVKSMADEALNVSNEAHTKAIEAVNVQKRISETLKSLNSSLTFTSERLNLTIETVKGVQDQVDLAYKDSVSILRDVRTISLPTVNVMGIKESSVEFIKTANEQQEKAEKLLADNKNLLIELNDQLSSAEILLRQGSDQQQLADGLLAEVDDAYHRAEDAVKSGDITLQDAQKTYATLQEFNKIVQESKDKAKEARFKLPEIEKLISETEDKTKEVEKTLLGAEETANMAKQTAEQAEKTYAQVASKEAYEIRKRAEGTLSEQNKLVVQVDQVKGEVTETSQQISGLKGRADSDQNTISEAKEKVGQAKASAVEVRKQVEKASEDIANLIKEVNSLPEIDEASLSTLTKKLEAAEKEFEQSKIEEELNKFKTSRLDQVDRIKRYKNELDQLANDVKDLERIKDSLPNGCFKRGTIET